MQILLLTALQDNCNLTKTKQRAKSELFEEVVFKGTSAEKLLYSGFQEKEGYDLKHSRRERGLVDLSRGA